MKTLAFDPGAKRMGWVCFEGSKEDARKKKPPVEVGAGIFGLERESNGSKDEPFQKYRLKLIDFWVAAAPDLFRTYKPDVVVAEIVPAIGGKNFRSGAVQSQLAETAITTVLVVARSMDIPVEQIGATSVKARVGGTKKATKVGIRNGVYALMPGTKKKWHEEWKEHADMSDAFAIGLTHLGYDVRK